MASHVLGYLQLPAVLEVSRDTRRTETMGADFCLYAGRPSSPLNHHVNVWLSDRSPTIKLPMFHGREEGSRGLFPEPGGGDPFVEELLKIVVTGKLGDFATLF